ncbi:uncharacterized protein LOC127748895 [Frankliniella occidentalis]|uniref:Uncharacterized protein LOC127748895 n=1 Tax=Frankliniella occidentalis TaxID=133901 RepID=A0A9C6WSN5_FRAOC|nr:uncharacterized protein LOC127748895 [Frankliniella occidentalis]
MPVPLQGASHITMQASLVCFVCLCGMWAVAEPQIGGLLAGGAQTIGQAAGSIAGAGNVGAGGSETYEIDSPLLGHIKVHKEGQVGASSAVGAQAQGLTMGAVQQTAALPVAPGFGQPIGQTLGQPFGQQPFGGVSAGAPTSPFFSG